MHFFVGVALSLFLLGKADSRKAARVPFGFPPEPVNVNYIRSKLDPGLSISYKKPEICETTPNIPSYSGYINLPSLHKAQSSLSSTTPYNTSIFYWYFPARNVHLPSRSNDPKTKISVNTSTPAPLVIWLGGGPGQSALSGATQENGPCYVNDDMESTLLNEWSFNNYANMLYIDVPVDAGFSYSEIEDGVLHLATQSFVAGLHRAEGFEANTTHIPGRLSSQDPSRMANTTETNARTLWNAVQLWMREFPHCDATDEISVWTNSYGGYIAPAFLTYILSQNDKIANGTIPSSEARRIVPQHLGLTNACVDIVEQGQGTIDYARNNTYNMNMLPGEAYYTALQSFAGPGGCKDLTLQCRKVADEGDPYGEGNNKTVNHACQLALAACQPLTSIPETMANRSSFDIAHRLPDPYPDYNAVGYFNQAFIQQALGVPVNFTYLSNTVFTNFLSTGDAVRQSKVHLEKLLQKGVKVSMVYGDRDSRCNWTGAEDLSLNLSYPNAAKFRSSGYEKIATNNSYSGGMVRQHGSLSFSRVYDAGHAVGTYQPETVYTIFMRSLFSTSIATGLVSAANCSSKGPQSIRGIKNKLPQSLTGRCNTLQIQQTCAKEQIMALVSGNAVVQNHIVVFPTSLAGSNPTSIESPSTDK